MNQTIAERYNLAPIHERTIFADDVRQAFTKLTEKQRYAVRYGCC